MILLWAALGCAKPTPTPTAPEPVPAPEEAAARTRDVTFPGPYITMEGVLHLPAGDGPFPVVVLVHGSGPQSRDETAPGQLGVPFPAPIPVFTELAEGLADGGYAVLRYDKRSCVPINGCKNRYPFPDQSSIRVDDFAADAAGALRWLAAQREIDASKRVVLGHSQGGSFVPELVRDEELAAGVMMAAPHGELADLLDAQATTATAQLVAQGVDADTAKSQTATVRAMASGVRSIAEDPTSIPSLGGIPVGFWVSWIEVGRRARKVAVELDAPLLVVSGSRDTNVPPSETEGWRQTLQGTGAEVVVLDCLTHAMSCWPEDGEPAKHVDAAAIDTIVGFLDRALQ